MKNASITTVNTFSLKPINVGAEGYCTSIDISADGLRKVVGTDVRSPYIKDSTDTVWRPLMTTANMPTALYDPRTLNGQINLCDGDGTYSVIMAPSNKDIIYVGWNAYILMTTTAGVGANSWVKLNLAAKKMASNRGEPRLFTNRFAVHPTLPYTFLVGTMEDGAWYTTDANLGATCTFTQITGITAGANVGSDLTPHLVAIDPGNPLYVYITKQGTGVYRSTTGVAGTFTLIGGVNMPTNIRQMEVCNDGTVWICGYNADTNIYRIPRGVGTTWTLFGTAAHGMTYGGGMGVNPANSSILFVTDSTGAINYMTNGTSFVRSDGSAAWTAFSTGSDYMYQNYTDVPFGENYKGMKGGAKSLMDAAGVMWTAHGTGVNRCTPITSTAAPWNYYDESKGIEELIIQKALSIPGNPRPLFGTLDKGIVRPIDLDRFSCQPIFIDPAIDRTRVQHAFDLDYATGDTSYVVCPMNFQDVQHGRSKDGGKTWVKWPTQPPSVIGGSICSTGTNKAIYLPSNNLTAYYTLNDGTSWNPLNLPGAGTIGQGNWSNQQFLRRFQIAADHERVGYAVVVTRNDQTPATSVLVTADHGVTWTQKYSTVIDPSGETQQFSDCTIDYIPGHAGELLYTCGNAGNYFPNNYLMKSVNDGAAWSQIRPTELRGIYFFAFGPTAPGASYPLIFLYGKVSGVLGLYYTQDFFATTPILIARFPGGNIDDIIGIEGDKNIWGRCYYYWYGGGAGYVDLLDRVGS